LIKSELLMTAIVFPLKKFSAVPRPDTGAPTSFPSGHTAQVFAAATFLHKEYGKEHPIYSVLAYTTATGVGLLRVMNNRHWISDVLAGAGIGILSTNLAYLTVRNKPKTIRKHPHRDVVMAPSYGNKTAMLSMVISLN
jgi:membrane-associated phospholipid phosphatase